MSLKKIKPQTGLLIIIPVVLAMLVAGVYMWPSGKSAEEIMRNAKAQKDSIKAAETPEEFK